MKKLFFAILLAMGSQYIYASDRFYFDTGKTESIVRELNGPKCKGLAADACIDAHKEYLNSLTASITNGFYLATHQTELLRSLIFTFRQARLNTNIKRHLGETSSVSLINHLESALFTANSPTIPVQSNFEFPSSNYQNFASPYPTPYQPYSAPYAQSLQMNPVLQTHHEGLGSSAKYILLAVITYIAFYTVSSAI